MMTDPEKQEKSTQRKLADSLSDIDQVNVLLNEKKKLKKVLEEKEGQIRKLNLVKMYRAKNDLANIDTLTQKWRAASQEAVQELYGTLCTDTRPEMGVFLRTLQIDEKHIRYDADEDRFY